MSVSAAELRKITEESLPAIEKAAEEREAQVVAEFWKDHGSAMKLAAQKGQTSYMARGETWEWIKILSQGLCNQGYTIEHRLNLTFIVKW